jgi:hypothetical protein
MISGIAVGIATEYGLDGGEFGVGIPVWSGILTSPYRLNRPWGVLPAIQWISEGIFSGVKQQRREADHSPPTSAEVKKA